MKSFPDLASLMGLKRVPAVQTPEQMKAVFAAMRASGSKPN